MTRQQTPSLEGGRSSPLALPVCSSPRSGSEPPRLPSQILDAAADLIEPEGAWTQGVLAADRDGNKVLPTDPDATCWCIGGATWRATGDGIGWQADRFVTRTVGEPYEDFNDAPDRTQAEVVAALRKAAELARSEGQ